MEIQKLKSPYNLRKTRTGADSLETTSQKKISGSIIDPKSVSLVSSKISGKKSESSSHKKQRLERLELRQQQAALEEELRISIEKDRIEQQSQLDKVKREFELRALDRRSENVQRKAALALKINELDEKMSDLSFDSQDEDRDVVGMGEETVEEKMERNSNASKRSATTDDRIRMVSSNTDNSEMLKQIVKMQPTNIKEFGGEQDDYFEFKASFAQLEKKLVYDNDELLSILLAHVKGEAKRALTGILHGSGQYAKAWDILAGRYGNKTRLANIKLEAIRKHPTVTAGNLTQLRNFVDSLSAFMETMRCCEREHEMRSALLIVDLLHKLPRNMVYSWNKMVARGQVEETLLDFREYLLCEEKVWEADPTCSKSADKNGQINDKKIKDKTKERYTGVTVAGQCAADCALHQGKGHSTEKCRYFVSKSVPERLNIAKKYGLCFRCLTKGHMTKDCNSTTTCANCGRRHHELLHARESSVKKTSDDKALSEDTQQKTISYSAVQHHRTLLGILPVKIMGPKKSVTVNALIDYGSNSTLINLDVAKESGILPEGISTKPVMVTGVHGEGRMNVAHVKMKVQAVNNEQRNETFAVNALAVENLDGPTQELKWETVKSSFPDIDSYGLVDVSAEKAQMIIGTDNLSLILYDQYIRPVHGHAPVMVRTVLGYVLLGRLPSDENQQAVVYRSEVKIDTNLSDQVDEYFRLENLGIEDKACRLLCVEDRKALEVIEQGTKKIKDENAFLSAMPWKNKPTSLPNNKEMAMQRLLSLEKKLNKQPELYEKYKQAIADDIQKGYIRELTEDEEAEPSSIKWYLPHWNVTHKRKPDKFRRVYDCSAVFKGESLNKHLLKGPNLLSDLFDVLLRFREYPIALAADISEMYNQIRIPEDDQPCLRFLWRNNIDAPVKTFQFLRMLFGDVSAPARAVYVLKSIARDGLTDKPFGAGAIRDNMYLDDLMTSCSSVETAISIQEESRSLIQDGGFTFKKWVTNLPEVLQGIEPQNRSDDFAPSQKSNVTANHVLGVEWRTDGDYFGYQKHIWQAGETKREILSQLTSLWDPLGFLAPFIIRAKLIVQELWKLSTGWDDKVPIELYEKWRCWLEEANEIDKVKIPRALISRLESPQESSLQVFCDASQLAYGVVIYLRNVYKDGLIEIRFIAAKTRVAPHRPAMTIPRLELNAAVLAARLVHKVDAALTSTISKVDLWSDSTIVLSWLAQRTTLETKYVVNRVINILDNLKHLRCAAVKNSIMWRHVATEDNASDDCTRGLNIKQLFPEALSRYWQGPDILQQTCETWSPGFAVESDFTAPSFSSWVAVAKEESLFMLERCATYIRAQRIVAYVNRFIENCKFKLRKERRHGCLQVYEYQEAEKLLIKESQQLTIQPLYDAFQCESGKRSWIKNLQPFVKDDLIRVGGRLSNATSLSYAFRHPVILDGTSKLASLIVQDYHERHGHAGLMYIKNVVREKYWITKLSWLIKKVKKMCIICRKFNGKTITPQMAALPNARTEPTMPFVKCGVDYFGPFMVKRGRATEKVWGVIFTCFTTRAVHLELADSLSSDCFINVFRRFVGRRGEVSEVWSDNGTNFVGGERELYKEVSKLKKSDIEDQLAAKQVKWHFNPPAASHFGGVWERLIRSVRRALHHVMRGRAMTYSVFETALIEVEALMNSRPIARVSEDVNDMSTLTPGHFLILRPFTSRNFAIIQDKEVNARSAWKKSQALVNMFWKRWLREYVPNLRELTKWTDRGQDIKEGDIVLLIESGSHRGQWPLARVEKTFPGADGVVRVVDIRVNGTILRRPVTKLSFVCGPNCDISY